MKKSIALGLAAFAATLSSPALANVIITNGTIELGVRNLGNLGVGSRGLFDARNSREVITPGCICEGWGVADAGNGTTGFANVSAGTSGLNLVSFGSTASTATSIVDILGASQMRVTHAFGLSASADLYKVDVTIQNLGANAITDLRYRRVMDWDIEPTAFSEYVTIQGTSATALLYSSDNGFASANPLTAGGSILAGTVNTDFVDSGPADHGALFDFGFGSLGAGQSMTFSIFYGASLTEASALAALGAVGAELYSFGQSRDDRTGGRPGYSTFIFGFKGVGGTVVPGAVPEPTTWAMLILGMGAVGGAMRRRKQAVRVAFA
jgi:hypothetical protein